METINNFCMDYTFTKLGKAMQGKIPWQELLKPEYNGIYYTLEIHSPEEKYEPLLAQVKKELHQDQNFRAGSKELEDIVEPKRRYTMTERRVRPRNKKYHAKG